MEQTQAEAMQARLIAVIQEQWGVRDPDVQVTGALRENGMIDLTVVSALFEGKDGLEREAFFWPVFSSVPRSDLIHMTYCLLLTPQEARQHFSL